VDAPVNVRMRRCELGRKGKEYDHPGQPWLVFRRNGRDRFSVVSGVRSGEASLLAFAWAVLLAVGCASAAGPGQQAGAVPWVTRPAPAYVQPLPPKPTAAYPPCRARQLAGRPGRGGPAAGTVYQEVRLINRSNRPCTLSGGPTAVTGVPVS